VKYPFPPVYLNRRHDDWIFPFSLLPRWINWVAVPLPTRKVFGNQESSRIPIQEDFPLAPDLDIVYGHYVGEEFIQEDSGASKRHVLAYHPVPKAGQWSIQAHYWPQLERWIPDYLTLSIMFFGKRLHINLGFKPDLTLGDWATWLEGSCTWTRIVD